MEINKMVYTTMTTNQMIDDLLTDDYASWTYSQAEILAEHIEDFADETDWEWCRVAVRCDYSGYKNRAEAESMYNLAEDELEDHTTVLECADGQIVIQDF
jgi:hypothetical protein